MRQLPQVSIMQMLFFDYLLMGYSVEEFQVSRLYKTRSDWIKANIDIA